MAGAELGAQQCYHQHASGYFLQAGSDHPSVKSWKLQSLAQDLLEIGLDDALSWKLTFPSGGGEAWVLRDALR